MRQDIYSTLYIGLGGTALAFVLIVPPWPWFNRHAIPWLPARNPSAVTHGNANAPDVNLAGVRIEVDGKNIAELGLETLRGRLALVPQDSLLFKGTVRENL